MLIVFVRRRGFTLMELLVVMAIIAVLVAMLIPGINRAREHARSTQCRSNLRNLQVAVMSHATDSGGNLPRAWSFEIYDVWGERWDEFRGWVDWLDYDRRPATEQSAHVNDPADEPEPGTVPEWWGDEARTSITNGTLWEYTGRSMGVYLCPTFAREDVCGRAGAIRSYTMNSYFQNNRSWKPRTILTMTNASKVLLFADMHTHQNDSVEEASGATFQPVCDYGMKEMEEGYFDINGRNQRIASYDGMLNATHDGWSQAYPFEAIGGFHRSMGNAIFLDGHVEALAWSNTVEACLGRW